MSALLEIKIDVDKIDPKMLFKGQKGRYLTLTASVNDEVDSYGQDISLYVAQSEDDRKANKPKVYLGNGKTFWSKDGKTAKDKAGRDAQQQSSGSGGFSAPDDDDLPF